MDVDWCREREGRGRCLLASTADLTNLSPVRVILILLPVLMFASGGRRKAKGFSPHPCKTRVKPKKRQTEDERKFLSVKFFGCYRIYINMWQMFFLARSMSIDLS